MKKTELIKIIKEEIEKLISEVSEDIKQKFIIKYTDLVKDDLRFRREVLRQIAFIQRVFGGTATKNTVHTAESIIRKAVSHPDEGIALALPYINIDNKLVSDINPLGGKPIKIGTKITKKESHNDPLQQIVSKTANDWSKKTAITEISDEERQKIYDKRAGLHMDTTKFNDITHKIAQGNPNTSLVKNKSTIKSVPQQTKTYRGVPMTDGEYDRLLIAAAKTTPVDSTFDVAHTMLNDPRVKAYVTKAAQIDGVLPIERIQWDLENYVK